MVKYGGVEPVESVAQRFAEETGLKLKFAKMWSLSVLSTVMRTHETPQSQWLLCW